MSKRVDKGTQPREPKRGMVQMPAAFSLAVYHRDGAEVVPLDAGGALVVGRCKPADVVISDRALSRQHARFSLQNGVLRVEDLGSTNGTIVGGARVDSAELRVGTAVEIGDTRCIVQARGALAMDVGHVATHDRLIEELGRHVTEARHFREPVGLLMLRCTTADDSPAPMSAWHRLTLGELRSVDFVGMYSSSIMEVVLPRTGEAAGLMLLQALEQKLTEHGFTARSSLAVFPESGTSADVLLQRCRRGLERKTDAGPVVASAERFSDDDEILAVGPAMRLVMAQLDRIAKTTMPVLIMGETGVGKELVARAIHRRSSRSEAPMVALNCGAIPAQLVESTLFGHTRGAYTGAAEAQPGVFGAARGGTVLLDEIGELPMSAQVSLLRVLETGRVTRVGSSEERDANVRVIAATHRDLEAMSEAGTFRKDLYYRINPLPLLVPPLRRRREDIALLAERFLEQAGEAVGEHPVKGFTREALDALFQYHWPGNVRELRNLVERACVICDGELIEPSHLRDRFRGGAEPEPEIQRPSAPEPAGPAPTTGDLRERVREFETALLVDALRSCGGDATLAARRLNLPLRTLNYKLKNLEIDRSKLID